jgi:hypothetical protein
VIKPPTAPAAASSVDYSSLTREELIELLAAQSEEGIRIGFSGKEHARRLARKVRPRVTRIVKKYSSGSEEEKARNCLIEGDNLQAMTTLFRERGQVDLVLTDPLLWLISLGLPIARIATLDSTYTLEAGTYVSAGLMVMGLFSTLAMWPGDLPVVRIDRNGMVRGT